MPSLKNVLLKGDECSLQTVPVDLSKSCGVGDLIAEMFLCEGYLVIFCESGNIAASSPLHILE